MITAADFDALLTSLRAAGLRVGISETLRAGFLLSRLATAHSGPGPLRHAMRALVVKSEQESVIFDRVFEEWASVLRSREQSVESVSQKPALPHNLEVREGPAMRAKERKPGRWAVASALGFLGLGGIVLALGLRVLCHPPPPAAPRPPPDAATLLPPPDAATHGPTGTLELPDALVLVPNISVVRPAWSPQVVCGLVTIVIGLPLGVGLYLGFRRRRYLPLPASPPTRIGAVRLFPDVPPPKGGYPARLLDRSAEETLVWGIGQFVSEQPTRRLDVPRTIAATAAASGLPILHFLRARHSREVWLWLDESTSATDPAAWALLKRLCDETETALRRGGLPVERAVFWGVPERLTLHDTRSGATVAVTPADLDERRGQALVAVLTDGQILKGRLDSAVHNNATRACLRALAHFPQLAFVDGGRTGELRTQLRRFEIPVVSPSELSGFLGGQRGAAAPVRASRPGEILAWAAACALAAEPISEETAFWLRQRLGLVARPEALIVLRRWAGGQGGPLRFPRAERARLLGWLLGSEVLPEGPVSHLPERVGSTLLGRTLKVWRHWLDEERERRGAADAQVPFYKTPGEQHLCMQRVLLNLWDQPVAAARSLYRLYQGELRDDITARLAEFAPQECAGTQHYILLPWRLRALPPLTQQMLVTMGLGAGLSVAAVPLRRPGRLLLAWGGCAGLLLAGAATTGLGLLDRLRPHGRPTVAQENEPKDAHVEVQPLASDSYRIEARSATEHASIQVSAGVHVLVSWERVKREPPDGGASADLGPDLGADLAPPSDMSPPSDLLPPPDLMPPWSCSPKTYTEPKSGAVFVRVCGGEFEMGSPKGDREADDDEKWPHRVKLDEYWIGKHETSNAQYRRFKPEHKSTFDGDSLPVQDISWDEAKAYCSWLGGQLPTEAEWEYAARGPEGRKYPWGKTAPQPGLATFNRNFTEGPEAIDANPRGKGPFGTLNQAGNVYEWVADCYQNDIYKRRQLQTDKTKPPTPVSNPFLDKPNCSGRVLRGGAFYFEPRDLRAACRFSFAPGGRNQRVGFRCVRGSRRQP